MRASVLSMPLPRHMHDTEASQISSTWKQIRGRQRPPPKTPGEKKESDCADNSKKVSGEQWQAFMERIASHRNEREGKLSELRQQIWGEVGMKPRPIVNAESIRLLEEKQKRVGKPVEKDISNRLIKEEEDKQRRLIEAIQQEQAKCAFRPRISRGTEVILSGASKTREPYGNTFKRQLVARQTEGHVYNDHHHGGNIDDAIFTFEPRVNEASHEILQRSRSCPKSFQARLDLSVMKYYLRLSNAMRQECGQPTLSEECY